MKDKTGRPDPATRESGKELGNQPQPRSEEEAAVWAILDESRQRIKPRVNKELQGEMVGTDILNLRLRA